MCAVLTDLVFNSHSDKRLRDLFVAPFSNRYRSEEDGATRAQQGHVPLGDAR